MQINYANEVSYKMSTLTMLKDGLVATKRSDQLPLYYVEA